MKIRKKLNFSRFECSFFFSDKKLSFLFTFKYLNARKWTHYSLFIKMSVQQVLWWYFSTRLFNCYKKPNEQNRFLDFFINLWHKLGLSIFVQFSLRRAIVNSKSYKQYIFDKSARYRKPQFSSDSWHIFSYYINLILNSIIISVGILNSCSLLFKTIAIIKNP